MAKSRHHIIISGTGRAGTTFLVQLFTALGLDTGFADPRSAVLPNCSAGMEWDIRDPDAPFIVKSPLLCDYLDDVLETSDLMIDHAIIPVRDLYAAAESRRYVSSTTDVAFFPGVPGGLWHTQVPEDQEAVLANELYKIIHTIAKRDIPMTLLFFPRLIHDAEYLYSKIRFMLSRIEYREFLETFKQTARPELVHDFNERPLSQAINGRRE